MRTLIIVLIWIACIFMLLMAAIAKYPAQPSDYHPPPIGWLQDEEGLNIAPRVTFEPKP